ncbi:MAG TPA: hypothetical protein VH105_05280 [Burkholderiales bacterium]|jgi:hypothetical protein|nr:hypothetical protein [Burkholderiales bacterium]
MTLSISGIIVALFAGLITSMVARSICYPNGLPWEENIAVKYLGGTYLGVCIYIGQCLEEGSLDAAEMMKIAACIVGPIVVGFGLYFILAARHWP